MSTPSAALHQRLSRHRHAINRPHHPAVNSAKIKAAVERFYNDLLDEHIDSESLPEKIGNEYDLNIRLNYCTHYLDTFADEFVKAVASRLTLPESGSAEEK